METWNACAGPAPEHQAVGHGDRAKLLCLGGRRRRSSGFALGGRALQDDLRLGRGSHGGLKNSD